jgi:phage terminase large subunit
MYLKLRNGSELLFSGLDNVEKLKSIYDITGIWIDEASELEEADFNQLDIRLRTSSPYYLQMILSFNPISITHWLKKRFWDRKDPRARTHESTYKDNRFLTQEAIDTLESFKDTDEYYYMVYALNQWGVTGKTVFNAKAVSERLQAIKPPISQGLFEYDYDGQKITNIRWVEVNNGPGKIYRAPGQGRPYVIGGDTAGEGSDWFVGQVLDNITGEQVAVLRHQMEEDVYARQIYCLGLHYNEALLGIESNFSTYPNKELHRLGYKKLFVREVEDDYTGKIRHAFGFRTDSVTRPVIIGGLIQAVRDRIGGINDETTLLEMLTFVRNEKLRPEAEPGAHDDTILALAIAHYIRPQQKTSVTVWREEESARRKWSKTMWEDYENASPGERETMIKLWGRPER